MDPLTIELIKSLGLPTAGLVLLAWAAYRAVIWTGTHIAKPLVEKHMTFLGVLENTLTRQSDSMARMNDTQSEILEVLKGLKCQNGHVSH